MVKVSVVIPTHKRDDLLKRAIDSVLSQTYKVFEIIIVDDSSCLNTEKLVNSYNLSFLKYFSNPNHGASSSRNYGINKANGDFVAFLDDDDIWLDTKLDKQVKEIVTKDLDAVFCKLTVKYENSNIEYNTNSKLPENLLESICVENFIGATISAVINRRLLIELNGFDEEFPAREEYDLWIRIIEASKKIAIVEEPLAISFRSLENRSRISASIKSYETAIKLLNLKHESLIEKVLSDKLKKNRKAKQCDFLAAQAVSINLRSAALKYYIKSFLIVLSPIKIVLGVIAFISPTTLIKIRSRIS